MGTASCRCGAVWRQRGNRTGHCSECHETFEGIDAFDRHQRMLEAPPWQVCSKPLTLRKKDSSLVYEVAHPLVEAGARGYGASWRLRVDENTRQRLVSLANRQRAGSPEGDGLGDVDTPAEGRIHA